MKEKKVRQIVEGETASQEEGEEEEEEEDNYVMSSVRPAANHSARSSVKTKRTWLRFAGPCEPTTAR